MELAIFQDDTSFEVKQQYKFSFNRIGNVSGKSNHLGGLKGSEAIGLEFNL